MWAAEMKGVRWQWPEKRSSGRMKVTGGGGYHHEGCPVVVSLCQTGYWLPVKRIRFICPGCGLSPFPVCQQHLTSPCTWPLNQRKGNSATKGGVVLCRDFSLHSLQWSGKNLYWRKRSKQKHATRGSCWRRESVSYFSRYCRETSPLTDCLRYAAKLYVKWMARVKQSVQESRDICPCFPGPWLQADFVLLWASSVLLVSSTCICF